MSGLSIDESKTTIINSVLASMLAIIEQTPHTIHNQADLPSILR